MKARTQDKIKRSNESIMMPTSKPSTTRSSKQKARAH